MTYALLRDPVGYPDGNKCACSQSQNQEKAIPYVTIVDKILHLYFGESLSDPITLNESENQRCEKGSSPKLGPSMVAGLSLRKELSQLARKANMHIIIYKKFYFV
jgi:hypothetical protein